jgi:hypothetical protein
MELLPRVQNGKIQNPASKKLKKLAREKGKALWREWYESIEFIKSI